MAGRSQYGPAAGASGGKAPFPATISVPAFIRLDARELDGLLQKLRDPLAVHVFLLVLIQTKFTQGEFLSTYARLKELCTPPQPERGKRRQAPTYKQLRRVIDDLEAVSLLWRDKGSNEAQGQLRLRTVPRAIKARPTR